MKLYLTVYCAVLVWSLLVLLIDSQVVELNVTNIATFLGHSSFMLEFYAPWCNNCKQFEKSYEVVASKLTKPHNFVVGRVDISDNQAIAARFHVSYVPMLFMYRDNKIWKIERTLSPDDLVNYAIAVHREEEPMPYFSSPMGPIGQIKGFLISIGGFFVEVSQYVFKDLGFSPFFTLVLLITSSVVVISILTFIGVFLSVEHIKLE